MSHDHFNLERREILARLIEQNYTQRKIATILGVSQPAICKELQRNKSKSGYSAHKAQYKAELRRRNASRTPKKQKPTVVLYILEKLENFWSPEQISGRMRYEGCKDSICFKTIYRWISQGVKSKKGTIFTHYASYLRIKRRGKTWGSRTAQTRGEPIALPSIHLRPTTKECGHWECDLIQGFNRSGYLLSAVERMTGVTYIGHTLQKDSASINRVIKKIFSKIPHKYRKSITYDRGKELYGFKEIEAELKVKSYFCDAYSPQQKGLNENTNGLLRQFFPRKKDFSKITKEEITKAVTLLNHRPRKKFNYKTTVEILREKGLSRLITFI